MATTDLVVTRLKEPDNRTAERMSEAESYRFFICNWHDWEVQFSGRRFYHRRASQPYPLDQGWYRPSETDTLKKVTSRLGRKMLAEAVRWKINELKKPERLREVAEGRGEIKRTKHGVRIDSNDGKHYFIFGVWKSTKYEGYSTVALSVAGKRFIYTVDKAGMEALQQEISRGLRKS